MGHDAKRTGRSVDVLSAQGLFSPLPYPQWACLLNQAVSADLAAGSPNGRYLTKTERFPEGWVTWRVDTTLGLVPESGALLDGHVEMVGLAQADPARGPGWKAALRGLRTRLVVAPGRVNTRWGRFEVAELAGVIGGGCAGFWGAVGMSASGGGALLMVSAGTGAGVGAWWWNRRVGERDLRRWVVGSGVAEVPGLWSELVDLHRHAAETELLVADLPAVAHIQQLMWALLDPDLTDAGYRALRDRTVALQAAVADLLRALEAERAVITALTAPVDVAEVLAELPVPGQDELDLVDQICARASAVRSVTRENRRVLDQG